MEAHVRRNWSMYLFSLSRVKKCDGTNCADEDGTHKRVLNATGWLYYSFVRRNAVTLVKIVKSCERVATELLETYAAEVIRHQTSKNALSSLVNAVLFLNNN